MNEFLLFLPVHALHFVLISLFATIFVKLVIRPKDAGITYELQKEGVSEEVSYGDALRI